MIIDAREPYEYEESHVDGAINIPPDDFMSGEFTSKLEDVPKDEKIIIYCVSGARSNTCSMFLYDAGYTNVINGTNQYHVEKMLAEGE